VDDGLQDVEAAIGAEFQFAGVETGLVSANMFTQAGAVIIPNAGHLVP